MYPPETMETRRLFLRPAVLADASMVFAAYAQDPVVTRYLLWRPHQNLGETQDFLRHCEQSWQDRNSFPWVIVDKASDQLMGMIELRIDGHRANLGYVLAHAYWGRGYMPEAVQTLTTWALTQAEIYRVWAVCDVENVGSARVLEKAGWVREGILRRWLIHPNCSDAPRDCYCFARVR
jgi:ribosomal-protein-alanine N-acetyltransferase